MATKIRLQRHGRKQRPFYHIVVADSRAPRDGRFIEKIGTYNPNTTPATINLDVDKATDWLLKGATPTDTAGAILSYKGAKYKKHLQVGVNKGSITQEEADKKFAQWLADKDAQVQGKKDDLAKATADKRAAALKAESEKAEAIAAKIQAKYAEEVIEESSDEAVEEGSSEATVTEETPAAEEETPATEEVTAEAEAPAEEETPAAEEETLATEEVTAEAEAPAEEETPAEEEAPEGDSAE